MLTSFMVNNYVKADILERAEQEEILQRSFGLSFGHHFSLKRVLSMSEISMLIEMDKDVSTDKSVLYGFFKVMAKDILQENATKVSKKLTLLSPPISANSAKATPMPSRIFAIAWA
jgi:hypothetical protein